MPRERREAILDAFERSGMSGAAFARHIGVKYPTLASWVQKRRRARTECPPQDSIATGNVKPGQQAAEPLTQPRGRESAKQAFTFLEAVVDQAAEGVGSDAAAALLVETPQGLKLTIGSGDAAVLAAKLLRALEAGEGC